MSTFNTFSDTHIPQIDDALRGYLDLQLSDQRLIIEDALLYSTLAKSKRIRPLLTLASHALFDDNPNKIMPLACAIEMVHTYSLIHDDLPAMDDDDFRRGQLSCHKMYGEDMAILAGDILNTMAFECIAKDLPTHFGAKKSIQAIQILAHSIGVFGMAGGQVLDLKNSSKKPDADVLTTIHSLKTGAVLESCVSIPAVLAEADSSTQKSLQQFGQKIGLLFQIVDDILDVKGNQAALGKTAKKDDAQNKLTYVSLWGLDKAETIAQDTASAATNALQDIPNNTSLLENFTQFILERTH